TVHARKLVLAGGRDGSGARSLPLFPSLTAAPSGGAGRVFHASDAIDFARFEGGSVGVLGAGASAFDNAAVALEARARGSSVLAPGAVAAEQQVEMGGISRLLSRLSRS